MIHTVLIADRGEAAIRISRACAALGLRSVAVFAEDDTASLHIKRADSSYALPGRGEAAYLDTAAIVEAARQTSCDAVHPGCGGLSESVAFALACEAAGLIFVGPSPDLLTLFADKTRTRQIAAECSVPIPRFSTGPVGQTEEALVAQARHVEIQIIGDGHGGITHVGERDCTVQRRHHPLIEVAPSPGFQPMVRARMAQAAVAMARKVKCCGLCTFDFLLGANEGARFVFIEAKPRLQAQHTVTEEVYGVDLVAAQLRLAGGATLGELGLSQSAIAPPRGCAIQLRVTMESLQPDGDVRRTGGRIAAYEPPSGPGLRVDGCGYAGYVTSTAFDGLLAKVIVRAGTYAEAIARADRALQEFRLDGVASNIGFLRAVLRHPDFAANRVTTRWLDMTGPDLLAEIEPAPEADSEAAPDPEIVAEPGVSCIATISPGTVLVSVPIRAALLTLKVAVGDDVRRGQQLAVLQAMTLTHIVTSPIAGVVFRLPTNIGDILQPGQAVALISPEPPQVKAKPSAPTTNAVVFDSLRDFLAALRAQGQLLTITEQVAPEPDLGAASRAINEIGETVPTLLFTDILGFTGAQVALNVHGSWPNHALMLGMDKSATCKAQFLEFVRCYRRFPGEVAWRESAPWQECVIDRPEDINLLELLPLFRINRHDGGCFIDKAVVVSREDDRDRQTVGIYRLQVEGARRLGIQPAPSHDIAIHLQQAEERGEDLKIAIAIGNDPIITCVAAMPILYDQSEYAMAGALRGTPYPVVHSPASGLDIPWGSEMVLEGHIVGRQRETEGPFGESTGHDSGGRLMPVVEITKVSHRRNPILESLSLGMPWTELDYVHAINTSAPIFVQLKQEFPEVEAVNASITHGLVVIVSTRCRRGGFAKNIGLRVLTTPHGLAYAKLVIVVDETIDPFDLKQVMWALSTKFHPAHDLIIIPDVSAVPLDPGASPPGITHKMIIDATTPVPPDVRGNYDTPLDRPVQTDAWREKLMAMLRG
jgi:UbiD family decarboxylase